MTWTPAQTCTARFAHAMHIWELDDGQARYCGGLWTQSADPVRCPKCGGPHPFHDPACVVHPDLIQDHTDGGGEK